MATGQRPLWCRKFPSSGGVDWPRRGRDISAPNLQITSMGEAVIEAEDLSVQLGRQPILQDVRFSVRHGSFTGLVGPNGSGKTTLLRAVAGLIPYSGRLVLEGREVASWSRRALARRLAFVRQFQTLPFDFTVEELVLLGRTPHLGWLASYGASERTRVLQALDELEVADYRERSIGSLSGGELQRVLLAQALVQDADLLLLDEPTAHLDVHHQYSFLAAVRRYAASGRTVLAVFHDLELAARFASELIVLKKGRVFTQGTPAESLHPDLLEDVFRMRARVESEAGQPLRIRYLDPVASRDEATLQQYTT